MSSGNSQTDYAVVIPARYASTRLEGKPLLDIDGKPMIQRVYEQALRSQASQVLVATDDQRIADAVAGFGGQVCMTRVDHTSGTDRLQEVASRQQWSDDQIVVNVQGDEPLIPPAVIDQVAHNLSEHAKAGVATLCEPISSQAEFSDPNAVKVVYDQQGYALYFSRAPIPWPRNDQSGQPYNTASSVLPDQHPARRHIGIYAYRAGFLHQFVQWPPAQLEQVECLEQLRAMANGVPIHVAQACETVPGGVDTAADLEAVRARLAT